MKDRNETMDSEELMARARDVGNTGISPDDIMLTGRKAVVTAGGGGIGQGIALGLARFGADVAVLDIEPARCSDTQAAIERTGVRGLGVPTDVMDSDALRAGIDRAADAFGGVDILVNNAGGVRAGSFLTQPERSIRRHVEINLMSCMFATQHAANMMVEQGNGGSIVNVASIEGLRAAPNFAVYAACKAGMIEFTRTMALELSQHNIRVNCLAPDHTITPGNRGNRNGPVEPEKWPGTDNDEWGRLVPAGREGLVEEQAAATVWLCSAMSEYTTGITVSVDGGTWASGGWLRTDDGRWTLNPPEPMADF
jgi:NAD(P)-dependent dehydrogenase (short-subunit alcohol dehydrogenase family)